MDASYGTNAGLRFGIAALGLTYAGAIVPTVKVCAVAEPQERVSVKTLALRLPKHAWRTITWREASARSSMKRTVFGTCALRRRAGISGPGLRQIQLMGDRETGVMIGDRQRHRRLAVGLLAELSAILMVDAHRMVALLRIRCVVDDPRLDRLAVLVTGTRLAYFHRYPRVQPMGLPTECDSR